MKQIFLIGFFALGLCFCGVASAAFNFYVALTANGEAIEGSVRVSEVGGDDVSKSIEGLSFDHQVTKDGDGITHGEIRIIKRVDKSTPLLHQALAGGQTITAEISFYQTNNDTGETEKFQTFSIGGGSITGVAAWSPFTEDAITQYQPFLEAITIRYGTLRITSVTGSTEFYYE
jgi:type VI secretion system Hcp family effector